MLDDQWKISAQRSAKTLIGALRKIYRICLDLWWYLASHNIAHTSIPETETEARNLNPRQTHACHLSLCITRHRQVQPSTLQNLALTV